MVAPLAVNVAEVPEHIVWELTEIVGLATTVIELTAELVQLPFDPTTL